MKGGMGNMMKQAQQMQENMQRAQAELAETEIQGSASNGLIKITMTCGHEVRKVEIDDAAMDDKETLEDLLLIALKDAKATAERVSNEKMSGIMPAGFKLPF